MKLVKGKYNEAKIFTDLADESAIQQGQDMCDTDFLEGTKIRMMPDLHKGKGCTIGTTMLLKENVVPEHVGVDIGCGISHIELDEAPGAYKNIEDILGNIGDTVDVLEIIKPVYNFKGIEEPFWLKNKKENKCYKFI
ncbi:RtcB family protein [Oceanobacillus sojae]|uniref:RtcB family protein n=1 Tax=Oceanobacillus sojae TaxID=582851 RepID=UPI00098871E1|nr:RtcB family protein [Oceanobacillus sojae]